MSGDELIVTLYRLFILQKKESLEATQEKRKEKEYEIFMI